jgi:hypothetical protein
MSDFTRQEMMAIATGREIRDGELAIFGVGLSMLAGYFAQAHHAPNVRSLTEGGVYGATPVGGLPLAIAGSALFYWNVLMRFMENSSSWHRVQPTAAVWQEMAALLLLAALARTLYLPRPENGRTLHAAALAAFCLCLCWELPRVLLLLAAGFGGGMAAVLPELLSGLALCCIGGMGLACAGKEKAGNN